VHARGHKAYVGTCPWGNTSDLIRTSGTLKRPPILRKDTQERCHVGTRFLMRNWRYVCSEIGVPQLSATLRAVKSNITPVKRYCTTERILYNLNKHVIRLPRDIPLGPCLVSGKNSRRGSLNLHCCLLLNWAET
jgi:hypothetical protein